MFNFDYITKESIKEHNPKFPDHPYRVLIVRGSGSGKTNALLNLINNEPDILYANFFFKRERTGLKYFNYSKVFIEYSNDMEKY